MGKEKIKNNILNSEFSDNEDLPVIELMNTYDRSEIYSMLEVGSGLCRFVDKVKVQYPNFKITCLEINNELANIAIGKGFEVINKNFLNNCILSDSFDIVHCSHFIEHFKYPEITQVIDELLRITKKNGICIIRSPLMWEYFYDDLDHVRPYPPQSIVRYLNNEQQQKKGKIKVEVLNTWYRTIPKQYRTIKTSSLWYGLKFLRVFINKGIRWINERFENFWNKYRFPSSEPNGYVMIIRKIT